MDTKRALSSKATKRCELQTKSQREGELAQREGELAQREGELAQREGDLVQREGVLAQRECSSRGEENWHGHPIIMSSLPVEPKDGPLRFTAVESPHQKQAEDGEEEDKAGMVTQRMISDKSSSSSSDSEEDLDSPPPLSTSLRDVSMKSIHSHLVEEGEDEDEGMGALPPRTKNEMEEPLELFLVKEEESVVNPKDELIECGVISSLVPGEKCVVVQAHSSCSHTSNNDSSTMTSTNGLLPLDVLSLLCDEQRRAIGKISDVFGPVTAPYYVVTSHRNLSEKKGGKEEEEDESGQEACLSIGMKVFAVVQQSVFVTPASLQQARSLKGSDASNLHDEELPAEEQDFSDDEAELRARQTRNKNKRGTAAASSSRGSSAVSQSGRDEKGGRVMQPSYSRASNIPHHPQQQTATIPQLPSSSSSSSSSYSSSSLYNPSLSHTPSPMFPSHRQNVQSSHSFGISTSQQHPPPPPSYPIQQPQQYQPSFISQILPQVQSYSSYVPGYGFVQQTMSFPAGQPMQSFPPYPGQPHSLPSTYQHQYLPPQAIQPQQQHGPPPAWMPLDTRPPPPPQGPAPQR